jgi:hypothetical protein
MIVDNCIDNALDPSIRELENTQYKVVLNAIDMLMTRYEDKSCMIILEMLKAI